MKKFFACMLACLMLVSALPVSADWTDDADIGYVDAVDAMDSLGVFDGYPSGDFSPTGSISRAEAAQMIYRFVTGESPADSWLSLSANGYQQLGISADSSLGIMLAKLRLLGYDVDRAEFGVMAREAGEHISPIWPGLELEYRPYSLAPDMGDDELPESFVAVDLTETNWNLIGVEAPVVATDVQVAVGFTMPRADIKAKMLELIEENSPQAQTALRTAFMFNGRPAASAAAWPLGTATTFSLTPQSEGDMVYFTVSFSLLEHTHEGGHWEHDEDGHWYVGCTNGFGSCDGYIKYAHEGSGCGCGYAPRGFFGMGAIFPLVYRLRFETNGGSAIATQLRMLSNKVDLSRFVPVREGYTFAGWFFDAALEQPVDGVFRMRGNRTVYAGWEEIVEEAEEAVGEDIVTE